MDSKSLSCSRNLNKVSPFVFYSFLVCPSWCNWVGITWRAQYGKRRQKILKSNFNIVTKLKLNYLNSLWRKWPNPELQKLQFNREKPQSWMCRMSSQKQGFFFFPTTTVCFFIFLYLLRWNVEITRLLANDWNKCTCCRDECSHLTELLEEKNKALELVISENEELKTQLEEITARAKNAEGENKTFIDRWMLEKMRDAERLNEVFWF